MISLVLNLPYTIVGLLLGFISFPVRIFLKGKNKAVVMEVKSFWWSVAYMKNARAMAIGNIVLLSLKIENKDLEHELVHVEQFRRMPLIYPLLYFFELWKNGYKNNKYEVEAYKIAGNIYKDKN